MPSFGLGFGDGEKLAADFLNENAEQKQAAQQTLEFYKGAASGANSK